RTPWCQGRRQSWRGHGPGRRERRRLRGASRRHHWPGRPTRRPASRHWGVARHASGHPDVVLPEAEVAAELLDGLLGRPAEQLAVELPAARGVGGHQIDPARRSGGCGFSCRHGGCPLPIARKIVTTLDRAAARNSSVRQIGQINDGRGRDCRSRANPGSWRGEADVDHEGMSSFGPGGLFGNVFGRGTAAVGDGDWLQAILDVEAALARAAERAGLAAAGAGAAGAAAASACQFDVAELASQAALTGNPVPALVRALTGKVPGDYAGAVHAGATSQDVIDTAVMLMARRVLDQLLADLSAAASSAATLARRHQDAFMIGRTLLQQAVPVTFGLVAAGWLTGIDEARQQLARIRSQRLAIQFGGAAGTLAALGDAGPRVAALLADELGLPQPVLPWHTDRLRIIELAAALAGAAAVLGKIARDVTLLAQTEIAEVAEGEAGP